jgi:hypothetical protein
MSYLLVVTFRYNSFLDYKNHFIVNWVGYPRSGFSFEEFSITFPLCHHIVCLILLLSTFYDGDMQFCGY